MKTRDLFCLCLIWLVILLAGLRTLYAGDVLPGVVPNSVNYQGRLEKDNAPVTGLVHVTFRIFDVLTGDGCPGIHCLWESDEITVTAAQGIFHDKQKGGRRRESCGIHTDFNS